MTPDHFDMGITNLLNVVSEIRNNDKCNGLLDSHILSFPQVPLGHFDQDWKLNAGLWAKQGLNRGKVVI